jgi:hypothetical protein
VKLGIPFFLGTGALLLLVAIVFIGINFSSPHTVSVEKTVQVPYQVTVPNEQQIASTKDYTLESNYYYYYHDILIDSGQTFKVNWVSDNSITAYIMSENQFDNWNSSNSGFGLFNSISYLATGQGNSGNITYDVKGTGSYVAMLSNSGGLLGSGSSAFIYQFTLSRISYNQETQYNTETHTVVQSDNLYLEYGIVFLFAGIGSLVIGSYLRYHYKESNFDDNNSNPKNEQ